MIRKFNGDTTETHPSGYRKTMTRYGDGKAVFPDGTVIDFKASGEAKEGRVAERSGFLSEVEAIGEERTRLKQRLAGSREDRVTRRLSFRCGACLLPFEPGRTRDDRDDQNRSNPAIFPKQLVKTVLADLFSHFVQE